MIDTLRREFVALQERIENEESSIPFVFFTMVGVVMFSTYSNF